jgi:hypothetical protein
MYVKCVGREKRREDGREKGSANIALKILFPYPTNFLLKS